MPRRFYVPRPLNAPQLVLEGGEAHHLLHVLRMEVGDEVVLFDGAGGEATARIEASANGTAQLRVLEHRQAEAETPVPIVLATAVPKGDRFAWLVEKATELGVQRLIPLNTQRSIVDPGAGKLDKMRQTVVAASKQCGRSRLMEIADPISWREFLRQESAQAAIYVAHPSGEPGRPRVTEADRPIIFAVGPEGGFADNELELAREHGAQLVSLGPRILRIETAALALAAICASGCEQTGQSQ